MRTVRSLACIPAALILLGGCGNDSSSATEATSATNVITDSSVAAAPGTTTVGTTGAAVTTTNTPLSGPVQIDVVVGVDSDPDRIERVTVGSEITLNITNPTAADEFHVHGVDIEQAVEKGQMATMNFTIDAPGTYEVESHLTEDVLVVIEAT